MGYAEVEAILGEPGTRLGSQDDLHVQAYWEAKNDQAIPHGAWIAWWRGDDFGVEVLFQEDGRVLDKHGWLVEQVSLYETLRIQFRNWLRL